ncbi:MAG: alpha/beta hydrolase [Alphaproteobacteria bacterium]
MDWDDAYANSAYIPGAEEIAAAWPRDAAAFRNSANGEYDIPYGAAERERYDLFLPKSEPRGLFVFIHGGYWMAFGKSDWSHLAAGAVARGWAAMLPGYALCPQTTIGGISAQIGAALGHAAARIAGPLVISGHSAGGHLAARMVCENAPIDPAVRKRIVHMLGISGIYDLRPLMRTAMNDTLRLTEAEARRESPALLEPVKGPRVTVWAGAEERPEFRRQTALLAEAWSRRGMSVRHVEAPGCHHFNVIAPLSEGDSNLTDAALDGLPPGRRAGPNPA